MGKVSNNQQRHPCYTVCTAGKWIPLVVRADRVKVENTAGDLVGCSDRI